MVWFLLVLNRIGQFDLLVKGSLDSSSSTGPT
jgi:hypothetical protein